MNLQLRFGKIFRQITQFIVYYIIGPEKSDCNKKKKKKFHEQSMTDACAKKQIDVTSNRISSSKPRRIPIGGKEGKFMFCENGDGWETIAPSYIDRRQTLT